MSENEKNSLREFEERKEAVVQFAERLRSLSIARGDNDTAQVLDGFMKRFRETKFLTLVVGDFKSGKSSFVNALVGRTICPVKATPRTAKITRLTALPDGETAEYALIHFEEDRAPERHGLADTPLDDLVAHKGSRTTSVKHVDLFLKPDGTPLRHPLTFVDTPGLGSGEEAHSRVTRDYMAHADAVIFVFSAIKPFSETERDFLLSFRSLLPRTIFVVNQADRVPEEERQDVLEHIGESLRESVLGAGTAVPPLLLVSARNATEAAKANDEAALATSGLPGLIAALEGKLVDDHGLPLLRGIAAQQRDVCAGLIHQAALARDALSADGSARASFEGRRATLRKELNELRREHAELEQRTEAVRADLQARVEREVSNLNAAVLKDTTDWVNQKCASEDVCKKQLPAVLGKILTDRMEGLDAQLRITYNTIADQAFKRVSATVSKMEERTRDILAPPERRGVRNDDELRKAAAALAGLDAVAAGVGGATGGYAVARNALNSALVPSPAAAVLSVAAGVGFLLAAVTGVGWVIAGVAGFFAAIFGISHSSGWKTRVTTHISQRLDAEVFPKVYSEARESVDAFFDSLRDEVAAHIDTVQGRLESVVSRVSADYKTEERQRKSEIAALDGIIARGKELKADIERLLENMPPAAAEPTSRAQPLLPPPGAAA